MFRIGDFSKLTMISIRMLRYYDSAGLLAPEQTDPFTGYRYYSPKQLSTANRILELRTMGFSISAVKEILDGIGNTDSLKRQLLIHRAQLENQLSTLNAQHSQLLNTLKRLEEDKNMEKFSVTTKLIPELKVVSLRDIIPTYQDEGRLWQTMCKEIDFQTLHAATPNYSMAVFYDEGFKETDVDVEIRIAVTDMGNDTDKIKFKKVPEVKVASTVVKGSYQSLAEACSAIGIWISDNGCMLDGPMFNILHVSPSDTQNMDELVTEVCFPIKN